METVESNTIDLDRPPTIPLPTAPNLPIYKFRAFRNVFGLITLLFCAYIGSIFLQAPFLVLAVIWPKVFRRFMDIFLLSWIMFAEFIIRNCFGVRVRLFGDNFNWDSKSIPIHWKQIIWTNQTRNHNSLLILNHRTQLDWFFIWGLGLAVQQMKIILKESLSKFPGAGWAMQCASFVFLRRKMDTDKRRMEVIIKYLSSIMNTCQFLMFPEGTDLHHSALCKSDEFAKNNKLPYLRYTLHPRSTGFVYLVKSLMSADTFDIYDVTVAYLNGIPTVSEFLHGHLPTEAHYHVRRYGRDELPLSHSNEADSNLDQVLSHWLEVRWLEKEQFLKTYYDKPLDERIFPNEIEPQSLIFDIKSSKSRLTLFGYLNTGFWLAYPLLTIYGVYLFWLVRVYFILIQVVFVYLTFKQDGVTFWAAKRVGISMCTTSNAAEVRCSTNQCKKTN